MAKIDDIVAATGTSLGKVSTALAQNGYYETANNLNLLKVSVVR
jgi:hypothetical protein